MSHTPHELADDFPGQVEKIHALRETDAHFARLLEEYHEVNRAVHRAETSVEPTDDLHEAALRKQRMSLKDALYQMLMR